jgi:hypothetical protein
VSEHRAELLTCLQGTTDPLDGGAMVAGFLLVVELLTTDGERGVVRISSDAGGTPLAWHTAQGLAAAAAQLDDFDAKE